jgi:hypothetical protein
MKETLKAMTQDVLLSARLLEEYGFNRIEVKDSPFEDYKMPYFCKDAIILFFNEGDEDNFYIGYGEQRMGKYKVVPFRWITAEDQLLTIYKAIKGRELKKL